MKRLNVFIVTTLLTSTAYAEWSASEKTDPMTDKTNKMALTIHPSKEIAISFRRRPSGEIWATIMSTKKRLILISPDLPPVMRLDKHPAAPVAPTNYKEMESVIKKTIYQWSPTTVSFLYWHGKSSDGISEKMTNLVNAETLQIRVFETTSGAQDYSFDMINAKPALCQALELTPEYCQ